MIMQLKMLKNQNNKLGLLVSLLLALGSGSVYAADTLKGGEIYRIHCVACHGASGKSVMPGAPNFSPTEKSMLRPDMLILARIKEGKNACPSYLGVLSDRDILNVISYMRTFN